MCANQLKERLEQIDGYSKALVQAIRMMNELRYILSPLLDDEDLKSNLEVMFKDRHGAYAYNHLIPLFAQDLVRDISRLFLDDDKKACSLANIHRKVSKREVLTELRTRFRHIPDQFGDSGIEIPGLTEEEAVDYVKNWREQGRDRYEADFNKTWEEVNKFVEGLEEDDTAGKIKTFRDKHHSHLEMLPLGKEPKPFDVGELGLKIEDIFEFMDRCMVITFKLTRIITGGSHSIDGFTKIHKKQGEDMWRIFARAENGSQ